MTHKWINSHNANDACWCADERFMHDSLPGVVSLANLDDGTEGWVIWPEGVSYYSREASDETREKTVIYLEELASRGPIFPTKEAAQAFFLLTYGEENT